MEADRDRVRRDIAGGGGEGQRTIQDVLGAFRGVLGKTNVEDDDMGEIMLRGGSDRMGKGMGVWSVE